MYTGGCCSDMAVYTDLTILWNALFLGYLSFCSFAYKWQNLDLKILHKMSSKCTFSIVSNTMEHWWRSGRKRRRRWSINSSTIGRKRFRGMPNIIGSVNKFNIYILHNTYKQIYNSLIFWHSLMKACQLLGNRSVGIKIFTKRLPDNNCIAFLLKKNYFFKGISFFALMFGLMFI